MAKVHLRCNTTKNGKPPMALCAANPAGGMVRFNARATYRYMASEIVGFDVYKSIPSSARCAHCVDALPSFNRKRVAAGFREWKLD